MWGYGWGYGRGFGRGFGRGWGRGWWGPYGYSTPAGYTYVGPCRCGFGPHAFYVDPSGRLVHASQAWGGWIPPSAWSEVEDLKAEKAELEARLRDIEARLKEMEEGQG